MLKFNKSLFASCFITLALAIQLTEAGESQPPQADNITASIIALRSPHTGIPPSHWGRPGYESLVFTYDYAIFCMMLKAEGTERRRPERGSSG
jgi:hypothetical protein